MDRSSQRSWTWAARGSLLAASLLAAGAVSPAGAQQYTATGSMETSSIPPNTELEEVEFIADRPMISVNNVMFGQYSNVYEIVDQTPEALPGLAMAYSGADATPEEAGNAVFFGPIPAGTLIQPIFVRGSRIFVYMPERGEYAWIELAGQLATDETAAEQ